MTRNELRCFCLGAIFVAVLLVSLKALGERNAPPACPAEADEAPTLWRI